MATMLVTGGAGFVGSCLVGRLLADGDEVVVYDNFSTGRLDFLPVTDPRLAVVDGDIVDEAGLARIMQQRPPDCVFHLAAIHFIPYCLAHRRETLRVNVEGTQAVLDACRAAGVSRIVAASSAAVYGISDRANSETDLPAPVDIYGASKWFDEILLRQFHQDTGIACAAARLFNIYGTHETNPHVIPEVLDQLSRSDDIEVGNVEVYRDFIYVDDVAAALIQLARLPGLEFGVFNVGTGVDYSVRDIVNACAAIVRRPLQVRSVAARRRSVDRQHLRADCSLIARRLGWRARYDLQTGLTETLRQLPVAQPEPELAAV